MATMVPIVSKKSASSREKTRRITETIPTLCTLPSRLKWPSVDRLGTSTGKPSRRGSDRDQPVRLSGPFSGSSLKGPRWVTASMMMARTVAEAMPMRMAPRTLRT